MAEIVVSGLDDSVIARLRDLARGHGRSLEAEAKTILCSAAGPTKAEREAAVQAVAELRKRLKGRDFPDSVALIREGRDR